ncbi:MAG: hypothetical protein ABI743_13745 [bacterium]
MVMPSDPRFPFFVIVAIVCTGIAYPVYAQSIANPQAKTAPNPARKWVHIALGFLGLLYAVLPTRAEWVMSLIWTLGFLIAWRVFPSPRFRWLAWQPTDADVKPSPDIGILAYPLVMLWASLYAQPIENIVLLGCLAFGDGSASLLGQRHPTPALPWNPRKSLAGCMAFIVGSAVGLCLVGLLIAPYRLLAMFGEVDIWILIVLLALIESIPSPIDDNLRIAGAFGLLIAVAARVGYWM